MIFTDVFAVTISHIQYSTIVAQLAYTLHMATQPPPPTTLSLPPMLTYPPRINHSPLPKLAYMRSPPSPIL